SATGRFLDLGATLVLALVSWASAASQSRTNEPATTAANARIIIDQVRRHDHVVFFITHASHLACVNEACSSCSCACGNCIPAWVNKHQDSLEVSGFNVDLSHRGSSSVM